MARRIFKYPLKVTDRQHIAMPLNTELLGVQVQHGQPVLYAIVNDARAKHNYEIITVGTGQELPAGLEADDYVGTYQLEGGDLVFHVFG